MVKEYNNAQFLQQFGSLDRVTFPMCMHCGKPESGGSYEWR